jgi:hypothetical protein
MLTVKKIFHYHFKKLALVLAARDQLDSLINSI